MNSQPDNSTVIHWVVCTVCILAFVCVTAEAACSILKIPDMSGALSSGFTHVTDTLVGALIALLINTKAQTATSVSTPVEITNTPATPVPVAETH